MNNRHNFILAFLFLFLFQNIMISASSMSHNGFGKKEMVYKKEFQKKNKIKGWKKGLKFLYKVKKKDPEKEGEKKKMPFGVIALLCLGGGFLGLLIGGGIANFMLFLGWFLSLIFGLRGLKKDKNKFPAVIALVIAGLLFLSTITFLDLIAF